MARKTPTIRGASYFEAMLDELANGLKARDVTLYRWQDYDGWTPSAAPLDWSSHLEFWIDLGNAVSYQQDGYTYQGRLMFAARYQAETDNVSQARLHAALRDASEYLLTACLPDAARIRNLSQADIVGPLSDYVIVTLPFDLYMPR